MRHEFCRGQIILARQEATDAGIKIGKISNSRIHHEHYCVFIGDDFYKEYGACCAYDARVQAISEYIDTCKKSGNFFVSLTPKQSDFLNFAIEETLILKGPRYGEIKALLNDECYDLRIIRGLVMKKLVKFHTNTIHGSGWSATELALRVMRASIRTRF